MSGRTVRHNLAAKLASGAIKGRPGMHGHDRPEREPVAPGPMASDENVERVSNLFHETGDFYAAFREIMGKLERGE